MSLSPDTSSPILRIDDLRVGFWSRGRWVQAVDGASIHVGQGEGLAVIGESGSGKTLTMMSSLALIPPNPGVIGGSIVYHDGDEKLSLLDGVDRAYRWSDGRCEETARAEKWQLEYRRRAQFLAGLRIGIIFQNPISSLDPLCSVGTTLRESIRLRNPALTRKEAHDEAVEWLDRVHIKNPTGVMRSYPHQLSGGMCQRVMIAATLSMHPRIIIADEPTTGLDMTTKAQILFLLHEARTLYNSSLIFVTHEIGLVTGLTERVVVMNKGKVVDHFPTERLGEVQRIDGALQAPDDFAEHTRELLSASLKLEGDKPLNAILDEETDARVAVSSQEEPAVQEAEAAEPSAGTIPSSAAEPSAGTGPSSETEPSSETGPSAGTEPSVGVESPAWTVREKERIQVWQGRQAVLSLVLAIVSVVLAGVVGWSGARWWLSLPLLGCWGVGLWKGRHVLQTMEKHRLGDEFQRTARAGTWLGYSVPALWLLLFLWRSGALG